ncbi:MAG: 16S rRNA (guanine(527)-N(7))-methyltransferase RsmG [Rhizobiaceae bacterium]
MTLEKIDTLKRIAGDVSRETFEQLLYFEQQFLNWNHSINLASASSAEQVWARHILDSAQLVPIAPAARNWLDIGSGGGFPGAIVAILLRDQPDVSVHLVESNRKKAAFLTKIIGETGAPAIVHAKRIETVDGQLKNIEIVTARAVASLTDLLRMTKPWLGSGARALFQKGREYKAEIEESRVDWSFDLIIHDSRTDQDGAILEIFNLRPLHDQPEM